MITWPSWLPAPQINFGNEVSGGFVRTRMESGRTRQRPRFTRQLREMKMTFEMSDEQRATFTAIWIHSLNNGIDWFYMNLPIEDGISQRTIRFQPESYKENAVPPDRWEISVSAEMEDQT